MLVVFLFSRSSSICMQLIWERWLRRCLGVRVKAKVSTAWISDYIPQYSCDWNYIAWLANVLDTCPWGSYLHKNFTKQWIFPPAGVIQCIDNNKTYIAINARALLVCNKRNAEICLHVMPFCVMEMWLSFTLYLQGRKQHIEFIWCRVYWWPSDGRGHVISRYDLP